jgi:RimJ/RimL family protein N-acetyltransferase
VLEIPNTAPDLNTHAIRLTQLDEGWFEEYCALIADPIVQHWTVTTETFSDETLLNWLLSRPGQPDRLDWAILDLETSELLGEIVLNELDRSAASMNLRIALSSNHLDRGIGTQALRVVVDYGFQCLRLKTIRLDVWSENHRAIRAYEKTGFVVEKRITEEEKEFLIMQLKNPDN